MALCINKGTKRVNKYVEAKLLLPFFGDTSTGLCKKNFILCLMI